MLRHADIWRAIDRLAREHGLSASGLARRAGLDPTTFNKSKRTTRDGKLRWPSTESIAKVLGATGASLGEFVSYVAEDEGAGAGFYRNLPVIGFSHAVGDGYFDESGRPTGNGWDEISFPGLGDPHAYAFEISGNDFEPVYRDGDTIIVSPQSNVRRGDRVVVRTRAGDVLVMRLRRRSARRLELESFHSQQQDRDLAVDEIDWIARIVWVSQ